MKKTPATGLILLAFIAFIALGLPDSLLGVGWPSMRAHFDVPLDALGMLLITGTAGYLVSSFNSGQLIARLGVGRLLAFSCALTGAALIGYTFVPAWWMMVALGVFTGLGAGAIDAGLNTYAAANFSPRVMQWLHASYGVGVTFSPLIMTFAISTLNTWRSGYHIVGIVQLALAGCFMLSVPLWHRHEQQAVREQTPRLTDYKTPVLETLRQPRVWLSILLFIIYVGAEVTLGTWAYSLLTESRGEPAGSRVVDRQLLGHLHHRADTGGPVFEEAEHAHADAQQPGGGATGGGPAVVEPIPAGGAARGGADRLCYCADLRRAGFEHQPAGG